MVVGVCSAATDDAVTSLVNVFSPSDRVRIVKALEAAQPYEDIRTAYRIVKALWALGFTESDKQVSVLITCKFMRQTITIDICT